MIAIDTNILVYAHRADMPFHSRAADLVRDSAEGRSSWAIPWPCVHEFYGVVTNPRIFKKPTPHDRATAQLDQWLSSPTVVMLGEGEGYFSILRDLIATSQIVGARIHDARIAALCSHHGVTELLSADRDFGRFTDVPTRNPLTSAS